MDKKKKEMTLREYLSQTNHYRIQEEMTRPRVEIWPDAWAEWVMSHKEDKRNYFYCKVANRSERNGILKFKRPTCAFPN